MILKATIWTNNKKMNFSNTAIKYISILIIILFSTPIRLFSQEGKRIELVKADVMKYEEEVSSQYNRLIGNVVFKQNDIMLYCDSAHLYKNQNLVKAYSKVHICQNDTLNIYGDSLIYNGDTKIANMKGRVKMIDKQITLTTTALEYNCKTHIAFYTTKSKIVDPENTLTSIFGHYYSDQKMFAFKKEVVLKNFKKHYTMTSDTLKYHTITKKSYFFGPTLIKGDSNEIFCMNGWYDTKKDLSQFNKNAVLKQKSQTLTGDSLFYDKNNTYGKAIGNITIVDTAQNITVRGDYAESFEKKDSAIVTGNAMLEQKFEKDTLYLHGDTLSVIPDTMKGKKRLVAYHHVKFFKSDFQGMCDSLSYSFSDSLIRMFHAPVLWTDSNQLTAKYIEIKTGKKQIYQIYLTTNSFIISQRDSVNFNQIKGRDIYGYFTDNKLRKIRVDGNGETIYYADNDDKSIFGINKSVSSSLLIFLKNNNIDKISFIKMPDAILHPPKTLQKEDKILKGFVWFENKRPHKKDDIFNF